MLTRSTSATVLTLVALLSATCGGGPATAPGSDNTPSLVPTVPAPPTVTPRSPSACERIGYGDPQATCGRGTPQLVGEMSAAIDRLIAKQPTLFEQGAVAEWGDPRVIDQDQYYVALIAELDAAGICAIQKPDSMVVSVKADNELSEEYQPLTSQRYPYRGQGSYVIGCNPASFPRAPIDHIDHIFVTAYAFACDPAGDLSLTTTGSRPAFPTTCIARVTASPKTADNVDVPPDVHGPDIEWELVEGNVAYDQWSWQKFNLNVYPLGPGPIKICATVKGVRGCLAGQIFVPPSPSSSMRPLRSR